jgi:hypothetical protein
MTIWHISTCSSTMASGSSNLCLGFAIFARISTQPQHPPLHPPKPSWPVSVIAPATSAFFSLSCSSRSCSPVWVYSKAHHASRPRTINFVCWRLNVTRKLWHLCDEVGGCWSYDGLDRTDNSASDHTLPGYCSFILYTCSDRILLREDARWILPFL